MGLLDNLWDDTVAGPRPKGLAKLRRYDSNPVTRSTPITSSNDHDVPVPVTRSITILKNSSNSARNTAESSSVPSSYNSSVLSSPTGSSTPSSPFSPGTPRGVYQKKLMRRKSTNSAALERAEPRSPTVYDWMVISALDR